MYAMTYYLRELKMNCNYFIGKLFILKLFLHVQTNLHVKLTCICTTCEASCTHPQPS